MADIFSLLFAAREFKDYLEKNNVRQDGRAFDKSRPIVASINVISSADGSAVIRLGNTLVACGIKAELTQPKAESPNIGMLITNFEMPPLCSSTIKPGPPSDFTQMISKLISDIVQDSHCVHCEDLCIESEKLVWVLYCDVICLNNDGALLDAALMALLGALSTVTLPSVNYDAETEGITVLEETKKLKLHGFPVASSFTVFDSNILMDPTFKEEVVCGGPVANLIVVWDSVLSGVFKLGGAALSDEHLKKVITQAEKRSQLVVKTINMAVSNLELKK